MNGDQQVAEELSSPLAVIDLHSQCNGDYLLVFVLVCMLYVKCYCVHVCVGVIVDIHPYPWMFKF